METQRTLRQFRLFKTQVHSAHHEGILSRALGPRTSEMIPFEQSDQNSEEYPVLDITDQSVITAIISGSQEIFAAHLHIDGSLPDHIVVDISGGKIYLDDKPLPDEISPFLIEAIKRITQETQIVSKIEEQIDPLFLDQVQETNHPEPEEVSYINASEPRAYRWSTVRETLKTGKYRVHMPNGKKVLVSNLGSMQSLISHVLPKTSPHFVLQTYPDAPERQAILISSYGKTEKKKKVSH